MGEFSFGPPPTDLIVALTIVPIFGAIVALALAWSIFRAVVNLHSWFHGGGR